MRKIWWMGLMGVVLSAPLHAEENTFLRHSLALNGGVAVPVSFLDLEDIGGEDNEPFAEGGGFFSVEYFYSFGRLWSMGFEVAGADYDAHDYTSHGADFSSDMETTSYLLESRWTFRSQHRFRPFVNVGLGASDVHLTVDRSIGPLMKVELFDSHTTCFTSTSGGGFDWFFTDHLFVGAQARFQTMFGSFEPTDLGRALGVDDISGLFASFITGVRAGVKF